MPKGFKTEGHIILEYPGQPEPIRFLFSFSESVDTIGLRSSVSIGRLSFKPRRLVKTYGHPPMTEDCLPILKEPSFVSEIGWFIEQMFPSVDLVMFTGKSSYQTGPTGFLSMVLTMSSAGTKVSMSIISYITLAPETNLLVLTPNSAWPIEDGDLQEFALQCCD
mgnify:CR=1 FL=1